MYDIIILGSGPAGLTAALYGARAGKKTLVLGGDSFGGQLNVIHSLENYPGFLGSGPDLGQFMKTQAESFGVEIVMASAIKIEQRAESIEHRYKVVADNGHEYIGRSVIIATGAKPRKMDIPGVREFIGRGVSYCATCDGFFYTDRDVIVVGGGNSALSDALYLANVAKSVKIIHRKDSFSRAEDIVVKRVEDTSNISIEWNTELAEIGGDESGVTHVISVGGKRIDATGVFIAIGHEANTDYLSEEIKRDDMGRLAGADLPVGMYVAGDVQSGLKMQVATAVGAGCDVAMDCIACLNQN